MVASDKQTSLEKMPIPTSQLGLGMYVVELDIPWLETPFLFQGFEITSTEEIKTLQLYCSIVYIEVQKQGQYSKHNLLKKQFQPKDKAKKSAQSIRSKRRILKDKIPTRDISQVKPPKTSSLFELEIEKVESMYKETGSLIAGAMRRVSQGEGVDSVEMIEAISSCADKVLHSPDVLLWFSQLKKAHTYTAQHSLNVSILSMILGRHINLSPSALVKVGLCGLMHDMGKMLVPPEVLDKPSRLNPDEQRIMKSHTTLGYEILSASSKMPFSAIETALDHHERIDGHGYSRHIGEAKLSFCTNIVTIADMYDAITSDRVYQKGRTHLEATRIMMGLAGKHLDNGLLIKFIESIGTYPLGSIVQMTDNSIAIVVERNLETRLRPKIMLIFDKDKQPLPEKVVDLATMPTDSKGHLLSIRSIIKASDYQIDGTKYYRHEILQQGSSLSTSK